MQVKVNEAINIPPTANAGSDKLITLPINSVTLSGSGADKDGSIVSYQWTKISGPSSGAINNANSTSATATNLTEGTYQFELKVTDNKGTVAKDTMQVKVNEAINIPPTANAGSDKSITLPTNSVALSGSGSDSDGTIDSYSWVKISGPSNFSLNNSSSASANATGLVQGTYEFELTVKDNKGAIGKDVVKVVVNKAPNLAPSANAGSDQSVTLPANSVTLSGSGADKDGSIVSYQWAKISGPNSGAINNANSASATVTNLVEGNYQFVLTAQDNEGAIAKDTVKVIVNPKAEAPVIAPTASAGKDTTILYPASTVTLAGTATKGSAEIVSYTWKQLSGPSESVINAAGKSTVGFSDLKEGTYEFEFQVKDKNGAIGRDSVKVTVALGRLAPQVNDTISVYPNPVHDITTADINTGRINTNVLITVTDISGKTIYKKQMLSTTENIKEQINMSNLTNGTYIITIFFDNVLRKSIKVVKL
jgi:major membrane immunogen (membrane-anchored lipoprotein)